jgi:hypothetical protein
LKGKENYQNYRKVYSLVNCLGDLGGLIEIASFIALTLYGPWAYHSYILNVIKRLFVAKTKNNNMLRKPAANIHATTKSDTQS